MTPWILLLTFWGGHPTTAEITATLPEQTAALYVTEYPTEQLCQNASQKLSERAKKQWDYVYTHCRKREPN